MKIDVSKKEQHDGIEVTGLSPSLSPLGLSKQSTADSDLEASSKHIIKESIGEETNMEEE